jgi:hypothetical protein
MVQVNINRKGKNKMTISELDLISAVRKHALNNYETDGWDYLVECWDDGDILEQISDKNATTPAEAIKACLEIVKLQDEMRREVRNY